MQTAQKKEEKFPLLNVGQYSHFLWPYVKWHTSVLNLNKYKLGVYQPQASSGTHGEIYWQIVISNSRISHTSQDDPWPMARVWCSSGTLGGQNLKVKWRADKAAIWHAISPLVEWNLQIDEAGSPCEAFHGPDPHAGWHTAIQDVADRSRKVTMFFFFALCFWPYRPPLWRRILLSSSLCQSHFTAPMRHQTTGGVKYGR